MQAIAKFLDSHMVSTRKFTKAIIVSIFSVQVLVVFSQVVWRFVFNNPFSWSEELARYLQVWLIMLTAVVCLRKGRHLAVDYMTHVLPFKLTKGLMFITFGFTMLFAGVVIIYGINLIAITINQKAPALQIPIMIVYLVFPISGILMFLESLILFLKLGGVKDKPGFKILKVNQPKDKEKAK